MSRYIVLDVVFHAGSLNYDQGTGNFQELKKITKWDGRQYVMVSRYALRYSLLHWANKLFGESWPLAGSEEFKSDKSNVTNPKKELLVEKKILNYPEFDLFGYMITEQGSKESAKTRTAPVKLSHAISLTPFKFDSHFNANLDLANRSGNKENINPFNMEEHRGFYIYNITIDLDRLGKLDGDSEGQYGADKKSEKVMQLLKTVFSLKREIKGRMEDLSPWLVVVGLYEDGNYATYLDRLELSKSHIYKLITKEKTTQDNGRTIKEIESETLDKDAPKFVIDFGEEKPISRQKSEILTEVENFAKGKSRGGLYLFKRDFVELSA
jgi:CRISPR-associated protein Cas7/Cst2/DevR subtype I-B